MKLEMPEAFEDVAVDFSREEWKMLCNQEKELYKEVMMQNYEHMVSVGFNVPIEQLLLLIEKQEELLPDSVERAVTLLQKNSCDEPSVTYKGVQCRKSPRRMSLKKELRNSEHVKNFSDQTSAAKHELIQMENEFHKCKEYDRSFIYDSEPKMHVQTDKVVKLCTNDYCQERFTFSGRPEAYCQTHIRHRPTDEMPSSINNSKTCEGIIDQSKRKDSLAIRKKADMEIEHHKCSGYDKTFMKSACLAVQEKIQNGEKPCLSESSFTWKGHLTSNNKIQTGENLYTCAMCGRHFKKKSQHKYHEKLHTMEKPFTCATCGKSFHWKHSFTAHQLTHIVEKPYACVACGKSFARKDRLTVHERIHTGEKPHQCEECGKSFHCKYSLTAHEISHTREKPYTCTTCGKSFKWKCSVSAHQISHTGEKPYKCTTCDKRYASRGSLRTHEKIHTNERPYKCTTCDKSFKEKCHLLYHEKTHTGEKLYKCATCGKSFTRKEVLRVHETVHTGEKPHACTICGKSFRLKAYLVYHENTHTQ